SPGHLAQGSLSQTPASRALAARFCSAASVECPTEARAFDDRTSQNGTCICPPDAAWTLSPPRPVAARIPQVCEALKPGITSTAHRRRKHVKWNDRSSMTRREAKRPHETGPNRGRRRDSAARRGFPAKRDRGPGVTFSKAKRSERTPQA